MSSLCSGASVSVDVAGSVVGTNEFCADGAGAGSGAELACGGAAKAGVKLVSEGSAGAFAAGAGAAEAVWRGCSRAGVARRADAFAVFGASAAELAGVDVAAAGAGVGCWSVGFVTLPDKLKFCSS